MSGYQKEIIRFTKKQKSHFEETDQASEPHMAKMLELIRLGVLNNYDYMPRSLIDKVDGVYEQIDNVSRDIGILRKNQKGILQMKKRCNRNEECL